MDKAHRFPIGNRMSYSFISATSTKYAPWYIIPADDKWYTRLAIAGVIYQQFKALKIDYPPVNDALRADLMEGRDALMNE